MKNIFEKLTGGKKENQEKKISPELQVADILKRSLLVNKKEMDRLSSAKEELRYIPVTEEDARLHQLKREEFNADIESLVRSIEKDLESTRGVFGEGIEGRRRELIELKNSMIALKESEVDRRAA